MHNCPEALPGIQQDRQNWYPVSPDGVTLLVIEGQWGDPAVQLPVGQNVDRICEGLCQL